MIGNMGSGCDADVIILSLERPRETLAAIDSALAQRGLSRHVYVVDQGSCAATVAALRRAVGDRPDVTLFEIGQNLGVAGGRNLGASLGRGRVIAALDNDAEFAAPDTLANLVSTLDRRTDLAAVGCRIVRFDDGSDDLSSWGYPRAQLSHAGASFEAVTFVGAGHAIRRAAWDACGGYDDALFFCWEEYDFCRRAIDEGWRIAYRGDLVVRHKVTPEQRVHWGNGRWYWYVRNRLYIARKYGDLSLWPRVAWYLWRGVRYGLPADTLRGLVDGWSMEVGRVTAPISPLRAPIAAGAAALVAPAKG